MSAIKKILEERFWQHVDKRGKNECWNWIGATIGKGYPSLWSGTAHNATYAHRVSYEIHFGGIPEGKLVLQSCMNRLCVNPNHLFLATHSEMRKHYVELGQYGKHHKRTEPIVNKVIEEYLCSEKPVVQIAEEFGVSRITVVKWAGKRNFRIGSKLTSQMCEDIIDKVANGKAQTEVAKEYGVHYSTISLVVNGKRRVKRLSIQN